MIWRPPQSGPAVLHFALELFHQPPAGKIKQCQFRWTWRVIRHETRDGLTVGGHDGAMSSFLRQLRGVAKLTCLTFFNLDANTVRQLSEQSVDGGKTWTTVYDLKYVRKMIRWYLFEATRRGFDLH